MWRDCHQPPSVNSQVIETEAMASWFRVILLRGILFASSEPTKRDSNANSADGAANETVPRFVGLSASVHRLETMPSRRSMRVCGCGKAIPIDACFRLCLMRSASSRTSGSRKRWREASQVQRHPAQESQSRHRKGGKRHSPGPPPRKCVRFARFSSLGRR